MEIHSREQSGGLRIRSFLPLLVETPLRSPEVKKVSMKHPVIENRKSNTNGNRRNLLIACFIEQLPFSRSGIYQRSDSANVSTLLFKQACFRSQGKFGNWKIQTNLKLCTDTISRDTDNDRTVSFTC